jgi:hypothetical protein
VSDLTTRVSALEASIEDVRSQAEGAAPKRVAADLKVGSKTQYQISRSYLGFHYLVLEIWCWRKQHPRG